MLQGRKGPSKAKMGVPAMRRSVVVWIVALLIAGLAVERHPIERALGLTHGLASALTTGTGQGAGTSRSTAGPAAHGGRGSVSVSGSVTGSGGVTASGTSASGSQGKASGGTSSTGSAAGSARSGSTGSSAPSGTSGTSGGGGASSAGSGAAASGSGPSSGASAAPPVTSYPGAGTVLAFYQAVGKGALAQAYALLAPSLTQSQSEAAFSQAYQGVTAASVESIRLESAANFTYEYAVTVAFTFGSGGVRSVSGTVTVQNASAGVGSPNWVILSLPAVPAA